ncbi:MAG: hypothetical protein AAB869_03490 [Patescibacteria group bacterium]
MKSTFWRYFGAVLLVVMALTGCATTNGYEYGGGNGQVGATGNNGAILGAVGAVLGSVLLKENQILGAVIGGAAGYYGGEILDRRARATGTTVCDYRANKSGSDGNGAYTQGAQSRKVVTGYKADCN